MFESLYDSWPFDMPPGLSFLWFYAVFSILVWVASFAFESFAAFLLEPPLPRGLMTMEPAPEGEAGGYRQIPMKRSRRLALGAVPSTLDDAMAVGYLRRGIEGAAETLITAAASRGYLQGGSSRELEEGEDPRIRALVLAVGTTMVATRLLREARTLASEIEPRMIDMLAEARLTRARRMRLLAAGLAAFATALALFVGWVRVGRAEAMHRPHGFLDIEMVLVAVSGVLWTKKRWSAPSRAAKRYISWLSDVTVGMRTNARSAPPSALDLAVSVAVAGMAPFTSVPALAMVAPLVVPPAGVTGAGDGSGGSSCNSSGSSCSGGSSCGGGGCGGGGGGGGCGG